MLPQIPMKLTHRIDQDERTKRALNNPSIFENYFALKAGHALAASNMTNKYLKPREYTID